MMPTDYEKIYQEQRHALGEPFKEFVTFFEQYSKQNADVLDVGCGQGRDALFIARLGHQVTGVDLSETGIAQLLEDAEHEGLSIQGVVADLRDYEPTATYDIVVIDRTLHMLLDETVRLNVLKRMSECVRDDGYILIADEKSNLPAMRAFFANDFQNWTTIMDNKGFLFVQKIE